jgi:hypothetical protein
MSKHTQGDWEYHPNQIGEYQGHIQSKLGLNERGIQTVRTIAVILKYATPEENEANGHLIGAVRDMYEALKWAVKYYDGGDKVKYDEAMAAIAKAEGKQS